MELEKRDPNDSPMYKYLVLLPSGDPYSVYSGENRNEVGKEADFYLRTKKDGTLTLAFTPLSKYTR